MRPSFVPCVDVFCKDCERHRSVTSRRLRESRESVNGNRRCIASFLLEFGEKLKRLKTQKSAEWVCVGARVVSYLFSPNLSGPLIARKDVGGGFLVLPLSASCGGLWCSGVCAVPLVARAVGVHWSLVSCAVSSCCSAGRSCSGHPRLLMAQWASCFSVGHSCGRHPAVSLLVVCVVA